MICIDISPEISIFSLKISIFSPSADTPFSPPLSDRARPHKENVPICSLTLTLITFKFADCHRPPRSATSLLRHPIYGVCPLHIAITASNVACPDIAPLDLCATDTEHRRCKNWVRRWQINSPVVVPKNQEKLATVA